MARASRPAKSVSIRVPKFRLHRPSGRAVVTLNGRDIYLGPYKSEESRRRYEEEIERWLLRRRRAPEPADLRLTVTELCAKFWTTRAETYYRKLDGKPTGEIAPLKSAITVLLSTFGTLAAEDFGPLALETVREAMIKRGWARTTCNEQVNRIRRIFRWAASKEIISGSTHSRLRTLEPLKAGRCDARETDPVRPVPVPMLEATIPFLSRHIAAMVRLELLTGARPGEICAMRTADIDRSGATWLYKPRQHKNAHRGQERIIYLGPQAQELIKPFLKLDPEAFCFSPREAEAERLAMRNARRKTPAGYGNGIGTNRKETRAREPGDQYRPDAYRRAIHRAAERAFAMPAQLREPIGEALAAEAKLPELERAARRKQRCDARRKWHRENRWSPNRLRHNTATEIRRKYGLEGAQVILGHSILETTQIYAERDLQRAGQIAAEVG